MRRSTPDRTRSSVASPQRREAQPPTALESTLAASKTWRAPWRAGVATQRTTVESSALATKRNTAWTHPSATRRLALAPSLAFASALPFAAHATDGYFPHGYGMKAKGRGGTATAMIGDAFGGANNPATMAFAGNRFEIGADLFSPWRKAERSGGVPLGLTGSAESDSNYFFIPEIAFNYAVRPDLTLGVTVYGHGGLNTDYPGGQLPSPGACGPATGPGTGFNPRSGPYNLLCGTGRLGVDLSQLMVAPTIAWRFHPNHSIGVSPLFAYQRFQAEGLDAFGGFSN